ncbi:MAG: hypothetical protein JWO25_2154, partial [Alphaproteobacteria bacterium]|nr:hypothetical protein [Alphaproteobacteria bacterium]
AELQFEGLRTREMSLFGVHFPEHQQDAQLAIGLLACVAKIGAALPEGLHDLADLRAGDEAWAERR